MKLGIQLLVNGVGTDSEMHYVDCTTTRSSQALRHVHCSQLLDAVEAPEWSGFQE
jgi:hypothetical protein